MKQLVLSLSLLTISISLLKAQSIQHKHTDTISGKTMINYFQLNPKGSLGLLQPQLNISQKLGAVNANNLFAENQINSTMPVVVLDGDSRMPVVKLGGYAKMPVKHIDIVDPASMVQKAIPGKPIFKTPQ